MGAVFNGTGEVRAAVGTHLGYSDWLEVTLDRIQAFADATNDHQWIHLDVERCASESPYGAPIAHGYLTLSLTSFFLPQIIQVNGISFGINYGANKLRFPSPVRAGRRIRCGGELLAADDVAGGVQATIRLTVEVEDEDKPACVVEFLARYLD